MTGNGTYHRHQSNQLVHGCYARCEYSGTLVEERRMEAANTDHHVPIGRRSFLGSVLAFFGFAAVAKAEERKTHPYETGCRWNGWSFMTTGTIDTVDKVCQDPRLERYELRYDGQLLWSMPYDPAFASRWLNFWVLAAQNDDFKMSDMGRSELCHFAWFLWHESPIIRKTRFRSNSRLGRCLNGFTFCENHRLSEEMGVAVGNPEALARADFS